jgi:hypothetical protein
MVQYDWKHPEKFYFDTIEYFGGKVNNHMLTYVNSYYADNQNKIKKYLEEIDTFNFDFAKCTYVNILANITFKNENKWILCTGCCEYFPIFFPSSLFFNAKKVNNLDDCVDDVDDAIYDQSDNEDDHYESTVNVKHEILEECLDDILFIDRVNKICNCCKKKAIYTCVLCDNADYCEECNKENKYEKIHLKKIENDVKSNGGLCDVCGITIPVYTSDELYCLCNDCFIDNPHRNHELTKIEPKNHLMDTFQVQVALKKSLYYHFSILVLENFFSKNNKGDKKQQAWEMYKETDGVCRIFNCKNNIVNEFIKTMKIKDSILKELKSIELEFQNIFDKMIRRYFVYEFRNFEYLFKSAHDIVSFVSNNNAIKFYKDASAMIKSFVSLNNKKEKKIK